MNRRSISQGITQTKRQAESGVALLTVLALLSLFAVVLAGFTYSIRMEENTIQQYADSVTVEESTEAAIQGVLAQLARDLDPMKLNYVLGRPQSKYTSLLEPWAIGYSGKIGERMIYDARSRQLDIRPQSVLDRTGLRILPTPIPRGVDEDPAGDVTGLRSNMRRAQGDGSPGLKGIDDDLDGRTDDGAVNDDDEDYRVDEDPLDRRRDGAYFPAGTGYDQDGDRLGVFDESSKININFAGNNFGSGDSQIYNLGISPAELDLPVFLYSRIVEYTNSGGGIANFTAADAETVAKQIVNFRYGSVSDGGATRGKRPGEDNEDDNGNGTPTIMEIETYSNAFTDLAQFDGEPFAIIGDGSDNDDDGLFNEEDEHYIGPTTQNPSGTPLTTTFDHKQADYFRPGDKIDNNGDGYIDEQKEGTDDASEFSVFRPKGDDRPFTTVEDLKLVGVMRNADPSPLLYPTMYGILSDYATIYSQSDEISAPLSAQSNEIAKINPNLTSNWLATDIWSLSKPTLNRADFQYSPKVRFEDLLALQIDQDGDFQTEAEVNIVDGKDNDGDGLIDEPSDDWDGNHYPSGDFDGFGEADVAAPAFVSGTDYDNDKMQQDKAISSTKEVYQGQRILGWLDEISSGSQLTAANFDPTRNDLVDYDEKILDILPGMVVEGDGLDEDGDLLIDDIGDFNGDSWLSYDPEWHVSEDAWNDLNGDGYPGLGADPDADDESKAGRIVKSPDNKDETLMTSLGDDDYDGYADFYDPQVLAAMYTPEWDGVDNDNDGEVDEIGERYIACFDDDEDGRMDEDPPDFQIALNLLDWIDAWMPFPVTEDTDIRKQLGLTQDNPVLADPITIKTLTLYSTRQRAFRMHSRLMAGPNYTANDRQEYGEQMRLLLPNPPQIGMPVKFQGVEAIRINEVMAKPVIRLEAEEVLDGIQNDTTNTTTTNPYTISYTSSRFTVKGNDDDGYDSTSKQYDTNWGVVAASADGNEAEPSVPSYTYLPYGFQNTYNPYLPIANMDTMAPAFIFGVTNTSLPSDTKTTKVGANPDEEATWVFNNIPAGIYDVVVYLNPAHSYRPEVKYTFNGKVITFRSDVAYDDVLANTGEFLKPWEGELIKRDTAIFPDTRLPFRLNYRLTPYPMADKYRLLPQQRVVIGNDGKLEVNILASQLVEDDELGVTYATSLDRIELINPWIQYVELTNMSTEDIDISGWSIDTPYGHYIIPEDTIIGRMKPSYKNDDGQDLQPNIGMPGDGVPSEPLLSKDNIQTAGTPITTTDLLLEDNKILLTNHKEALISFINANYPSVPNIQDRVVEPALASKENAMVQRSLSTKNNPTGSGELPFAQQSDLRFRLVDMQEDILTNNPAKKYITLYDPSGNFVDSFEYRTTFNNVIVNIPSNPVGAIDSNPYDLVVLPGYRGMEAFERTDPTYFETKIAVDASNGQLSGERLVPSSLELAAQDAVILNLDASSNFDRTQVGGYVNASQGTTNDTENTDLLLQRFVDRNSFPVNDAHWNGWDFLGDYYQYPKDNTSESTSLAAFERTHSIAREAVAPDAPEKVRFYDLLGGFENALNVTSTSSVRYTGFVWRIGLRELIRAGYDPDVDDQLTVRVLGRQAINDTGEYGLVDLPVGEVLVQPIYRVLNPGENDLGESPKQFENNPLNMYYEKNRSSSAQVPVFTKLRNGDTAFTIDLREQFNSLTQDLKATGSDEPQIEIMVVIRKSTRDASSGSTATLTATTRPDLLTDTATLSPNSSGVYHAVIGSQSVYIGNLGDDNYYFRGIEIFGRGRKGTDDSDENNAKRVFLAGTPGRDNSGYVPAYPRMRLDLTGKQRDQYDIVDNTAYVKNGPFATVGELSRLFTGNKFETVNTPLIAQRLEDLADVINGRAYTTPELTTRVTGNGNPEFRKALAQRERLDQWENQYLQLYNMITTSEEGIRAGLLNVNTATREVLSALPFCPPVSPGQLETLQTRYLFNTICADYILEGRSPNGHDMGFGIHNLNDNNYLFRAGKAQTLADTLPDYKMATVGREYNSFKSYDNIESQRLNQIGLTIQNVEESKIGSIRTNVFLATEMQLPDDGPYTDTGTLYSELLHMRRRDRFSEMVQRSVDRTFDNVLDAAGDLRERLNDSTYGRSKPLTTEDMEALMNRISNLVTVRSRAFSIITRGRIFDSDSNITAQRKLESVYQR